LTDKSLQRRRSALYNDAAMPTILVLYYSRGGSVAELARHICRGVESVPGVGARLRTVPPVAPVTQVAEPPVPDSGASFATLEDLSECDGLIMGSPTRFGNMAAPLKQFLDTTGGLWVSGAMVGKPAAVFTSTQTQHGGNESTLLTMMLPLLHHGMLLVGMPFTEPALQRTTSGGSPYGASHVHGSLKAVQLSDDEKQLAQRLGQRVAEITKKLRP